VVTSPIFPPFLFLFRELLYAGRNRFPSPLRPVSVILRWHRPVPPLLRCFPPGRPCNLCGIAGKIEIFFVIPFSDFVRVFFWLWPWMIASRSAVTSEADPTKACRAFYVTFSVEGFGYSLPFRAHPRTTVQILVFTCFHRYGRQEPGH